MYDIIEICHDYWTDFLTNLNERVNVETKLEFVQIVETTCCRDMTHIYLTKVLVKKI